MLRDFPTLQAIKQVAKCPLGGGPGLVRGRFLSHGGRGREGDRQTLSLQGKASGGWAALWAAQAWLNSIPANPP